MKTPTHHYEYELPGDLIAQQPLARRTDARLMIVDRDAQTIEHSRVENLPLHLREGDVLVINDSRVIPARLFGYRLATRGRWEGLFLHDEGSGMWRILSKTRGRLAAGEDVVLLDQTGREESTMRMVRPLGGGQWLVRRSSTLATMEHLERIGRVPLPHYIRDGMMIPEDRERYQTVYATVPGSVAAPTAGLHFTTELLHHLHQHGIGHVRLTLHVGLGTFRPITSDYVDDHAMHPEWGSITAEVASKLNQARQHGGRLVAVGTTSCRLLETAWRGSALAGWAGESELFIYPPFPFPATDALLTNFHLPRSSLLVLVRTFGGDELIRRAYAMAVDQQYRFFSYGDAMLIL